MLEIERGEIGRQRTKERERGGERAREGGREGSQIGKLEPTLECFSFDCAKLGLREILTLNISSMVCDFADFLNNECIKHKINPLW